ncbi:MAG: HEAT repeat domain-containing protein [Candidatus Omnitrophica bacterium]|nr:HEAT repeat domain-containing protein [Candidatus Omnitrophota bacterium]
MLSPYPSIAINILGKRKEKKVTPILIKILNSNREDLKKDIFLALSNINDPRAIEPLMGIVRQGENHRYYLDALMTLATMKYEGALEYVLERAKRADAYENGSIGMLKDFGKPEYIPLLIEIKNKIPDDYYFAKFDRGRIDDAIAHLKSLQQSQSPQEVTK